MVDIKWARNQLLSARIVAREGGKCVIRTAVPVTIAGVKARSEKSAIGYWLAFDAVKGRAYQVRPRRLASNSHKSTIVPFGRLFVCYLNGHASNFPHWRSAG